VLVQQEYHLCLIAEVLDGQGFNNDVHRFTTFLLASCVSGRKWKKGSPNNQNSHIYLHVLEMTHGIHEPHSSLFGSHSPSPKELRINPLPPHNILNNNIYYSLGFMLLCLSPFFQPLIPLPYPPLGSLFPHTLSSWSVYMQW
jgi:hypothetical protein